MAIFRVRQYRDVGRNANAGGLPLPQEPAAAVTQVDTSGGAQTIQLEADTRYIVLELWSGTLATGVRYDLGPTPVNAGGTRAGLVLTGRLPFARGCLPGSSLALEEAA